MVMVVLCVLSGAPLIAPPIFINIVRSFIQRSGPPEIFYLFYNFTHKIHVYVCMYVCKN